MTPDEAEIREFVASHQNAAFRKENRVDWFESILQALDEEREKVDSLSKWVKAYGKLEIAMRKIATVGCGFQCVCEEYPEGGEAFYKEAYDYFFQEYMIRQKIARDSLDALDEEVT
jgi:hypothetical protein